jgi:hypothetical protein
MNPKRMPMTPSSFVRAALAALLGLAFAASASAQTGAAVAAPETAAAPGAAATPGTAPEAPAATATAAAPAATGPLAQFAWLEGCWRGDVNKREFREQWLPLRGDLMIGISHTVMEGKTLDFEYLRLDPRADGLFYVTTQPGQGELAFRLVKVTPHDGGDVEYAFANPARDFPKTIAYRRSSDGWLYATVDGKIDGADRQVIYPMRRIDCETGELIKK